MKVFTCTDFRGHYPVGSAAVVVASNEVEAEQYLRDLLNEEGLGHDPEPLTMVELDMSTTKAVVLCNGDY